MSSPRNNLTEPNRQRLIATLLVGFLISSGVLTGVRAENLQKQALKGSAVKVQPGVDVSPQVSTGKPWFPKNPWVLKGDTYTEEYKLGAAEKYYRKVLSKNPKDAGAWRGLAQVAYYRTTSSNQAIRDRKDELYSQAIQHYMTALRYQPNYVDARVDLGTVYFEQARFHEAKEEFSRALQLAPKNSEANTAMGRILIQEKKINDALPYLQKAVNSDSSNSAAHYYKALVHTERGEYSDAIDELQTSLYQFPNSAPVHFQLGRVYELQGNGAAAVAEYKKATEIKPEYTEANLKLAEHYEARGDVSHALEQLKNALGANPDDLTLKRKVADLSLANRQPEVAQRYYEDVLLDDPRNRHAKEGVSKAIARQAKGASVFGDLSDQVEAYRTAGKAMAYQPDNLQAKLIQLKMRSGPRTLEDFSPGVAEDLMNRSALHPNESLEKGELLIARYDFDGAKRAFEQSLATVHDPEDKVTLGEIFLQLGQLEMAEESFHQLPQGEDYKLISDLGLKKVNENRRQAEQKIADAKAALKKKKTEEARRLLEEAAGLDQNNQEAYLMMASFYEKQKDYTSAIRHYHGALSLESDLKTRKQLEKKILVLTEKTSKNQLESNLSKSDF